MSKRYELERHLGTLRELSGIMGAMKNLALMETHKVNRFLSAQHRAVTTIELAAADFLAFHPDVRARPANARNVYLLIGSERGFCGEFNEVLLETLESHLEQLSDTNPILITVGLKLAVKLAGNARVAASLEGPTVAEEVQPILIRLMDTLSETQAKHKAFGPLTLTVLSHHVHEHGSAVQIFQPFEASRQEPIRFPSPPLLNLEPLAFWAELVDHYLFAVLHELFYSSLMAENHRRFQHMDTAIQRMETELSDLARKRNILHQEEITEEIEVIMLSVEALKKAQP